MSFRGAGGTRTRTPKGHSVSIIKTVAIIALAFIGISAQAGQSISEAEIEQAYSEALRARLEGAPQVAEEILVQLIALRPNEPQYRFELGVAQAEQHRCAQAYRTFADAGEMAQLPSFKQAVSQAMTDLCPKLAPLEFSIGTELRFDTNANGGAGDANIDVFGVPMTLSDDAVARRAFGYRVSSSLAYNLKIDDVTYLVPGLGVSILDLTGERLDELTLAPSLSLRYVGDKIDLRFGPTALLTYDHDGDVLKGKGLSAAANVALSPTDGVYIGAAYNDVEDIRNSLQDYKQRSVSLRYIRALPTRNMLARADISYNDNDYRDDFQDLSTWRLELGLQGGLTDMIGFDVSVSHAVSEGDTFNPVFATVRKDHVSSVSGNLSFAQFEGWYGRPYVGVTYTVSDSNFPTKDYDRLLANFGFTKRF
jgi:hypothetical protein